MVAIYTTSLTFLKVSAYYTALCLPLYNNSCTHEINHVLYCDLYAFPIYSAFLRRHLVCCRIIFFLVVTYTSSHVFFYFMFYPFLC